MRNKIRHFRKQRGLTLQQLAALIDLTPQSISRIENGKMRLSTEWLARFAGALNVSPLDLLDAQSTAGAQLTGEINGDGLCTPQSPQPFRIELPAQAQVVRLTHATGPYRSGEYLVCERLPQDQTARALTRDCLVELGSGERHLCRVVACTKQSRKTFAYTLTGLDSASWTMADQRLAWAAPVTLRLQFIP